VRANAARALGTIKSTDAVEPLIQALEVETDDYARGVVADALGEIGDERAIHVLAREMKRNREESWHSSEALVKIGGRGITEVLRCVIGDDNKFRWGAFTALPDNLPPAALTSLGEFELEEHLLAGTPYNCLVETGEHGAVQEILALGKKMLLGQIAEYDATTAIRESQTIMPAVLRAIRSTDSKVRADAAEVLGITEDPRGIEPLLEALLDEDTAVREKAAEALGTIKSPLACDALANALNDEVDSIRQQAAAAVGAICRDRADNVVDRLAALTAKDANYLIRWNSITSLGQIGGEKAAFILLRVLLFNRMSVDKEKAAEALSTVEQTDLGNALEVALYDTNAKLKAKASQIIGYYTAKEEVLQRLNALAEADEDHIVRGVAKEAAERLAHKLELLGKTSPGDGSYLLSDNESREGVLVHEVGKVVFEAGHIFRPTLNNDWGIDGEIEFKNDEGNASGRRVYLQLKSGDSYLRTRMRDGKQIFSIKNPRHAEYWQAQAYPVLLVIRDSRGQIRWMNITDYLRRQGVNVTQVEFTGEPFMPESVRQMRDRFGPDSR
jgi:HEAT repeat protein